MKLEEFKKLSILEQVDFINKELQGVSNVKNINKETEIEFTWDTIKSMMKENYYNYNAKTKQFEEQKDKFFTALFTSKDMILLKEMLDKYKTGQVQEESQKMDFPVYKENKNRSVRVADEVWVEWLKFCEENEKHNNTVLVTAALSEFMNKYKKN